MEVVYLKKIQNNYFKNKNIIGLVGEYEDLISLVNNIENIELNINLKVKHYLKESASLLEKFYLNKDIINKKISELSNTEYKIISLIKTIELNP
ncbi:MAG: hypothetical protein GX265_00480, partial [Mollicutes bacterium]|nr:hypothetical protein [Mollicutes bacterium]